MSRPPAPEADPRRSIPAVDRLLASPEFVGLLAEAPRALLVQLAQEVQDEVRAELAADPHAVPVPATPEWWAGRIRRALAAVRLPGLRPVINATGVILHTNLGRAPLARAARDALQEIAAGYSNLEYDLGTGARGSRYDHCVALLRRLTGAEDALVVNNNAAALVLALNSLARGRDAVISRGELVEIGDSFRIADIMARSGARMVEVGATNRTHPGDYRAAIGAHTAVLLKVHRSNFSITGFTAEVELAELASIAREAGASLLYDLGSGLLLPAHSLGLPPEPTAGQALAGGAHLVTLSGDKLLGGPQAGILLGYAPLIARCRRNPLCRALRVDKLTLAALAATLTLYLDPERARAEVPVLRMLLLAPDVLRERAALLAAALRDAGLDADVVPGTSKVGGGACPEHEIESVHVRVRPPGSAAGAEARLRAGSPPVLVRIQEDALRIDPRTFGADQDALLVDAVRRGLAP